MHAARVNRTTFGLHSLYILLRTRSATKLSALGLKQLIGRKAKLDREQLGNCRMFETTRKLKALKNLQCLKKWAGPLSRSNWRLKMLVFVRGGKLGNPEKNPRRKARTNNKLNPHMTPGWNWTRATLAGGERSDHCANSAPQYIFPEIFSVINRPK